MKARKNKYKQQKNRKRKKTFTKINKGTKIVATIGPSSVSQKKLANMVKAGMDVCRLNFSHSDHFWHKKAIQNIRVVEKKLGKKIGIVADLQGPRIRIANEKEIKIKKNEKIFLTDVLNKSKSNRKKKIILDWNLFYSYVRIDDKIFIEDGTIQLKVIDIFSFGCLAKVTNGGEVKPHKAVNIPAISSKMGTITEKDLVDLEFALSQKVDMIALSFVGNAKDLKKIKKIITSFLFNSKTKDKEYYPWIISKIERRLAIKNLHHIIKESDAIMIARGDLAVELPQEKVAILEKKIIRQTRHNHKPVIVATQMLASMETNRRPTRAEISDVTNAVIDHTDAVMLSGETAMGRYPVHTIKTMSNIIKIVERTKYNDLRKRNNRWSRILFKRNKSKRMTKTTDNLQDLLKFSSLRQENIKLRLSKRAIRDWGKASLIWGVSTWI